MMSPKVEGRMLQAVNITNTDQVLEIGSGSGYISACLAKLARQVTSIDFYPEFVTSAKQKSSKFSSNNMEFITGDIFKKADSLDTYDVILATGSIASQPLELKKLLRPGGRLFIIIGERPVMTASLITCFAQGEYRTETMFETCIPPLINAEKAPVFTL